MRGMGNMQNMMKQMQKMQKKMAEDASPPPFLLDYESEAYASPRAY